MGNNAAGYAVYTAIASLHAKGLLSFDTLDAICEPWRDCDVDSGACDDSEVEAFQVALDSLLDTLPEEEIATATDAHIGARPAADSVDDETLADWKYSRRYWFLRTRYGFC